MRRIDLYLGITKVILTVYENSDLPSRPTVTEAEHVAKRLRISRSKLYATALSQFLKQSGSCEVTERLNEVYVQEWRLSVKKNGNK